MNEPYEDIPLQGKHRGGEDADFETGTNVRAPLPPEPNEPETEEKTRDTVEEKAPEQTYQLVYNAEDDHYEARAWSGDIDEPSEDFSEVGRYDTAMGFIDEAEGLPTESRFVVFENTETGEVLFEQESSMSDNWTADERFNQITIFGSKEKAETYAEARRRAYDK